MGVYRMSPYDRGALRDTLIRRLEAEPDIRFALLHGSFISGDAFRDIDIAVSLDGNAGRRSGRAIDLSGELTYLVKVPVDVRQIEDAPPAFAFHALHGILLTIRDEERLADLIERTACTYLDMEPLLRQGARDAIGA